MHITQNYLERFSTLGLITLYKTLAKNLYCGIIRMYPKGVQENNWKFNDSKEANIMIIERYTIVNGIMYTMRDNKFKISEVTDYEAFNITLKNTKTNRNKRWLIKSYEITEKEIVIKLPDETVKRYQTNEWIIVHTSIHYF